MQSRFAPGHAQWLGRSQRRRSPSTLTCKATEGPSTSGRTECRLHIMSEDAMGSIATILATQNRLRPGDVYCLYGDVGAGKSVFSRAFIRAAMEDAYLPVPSPTYLLQNIYDDGMDVAIHHFDLYRLPVDSGQRELARLDLATSFNKAVSLVEWAERLGTQAPFERLSINISVAEGRAGSQQGGSADMRLRPGWLQADSDGVDDAGEGDDGEEYQDTRARVVQIQAHGARWEERLCLLLQVLKEHPGPDVVIVEPGEQV